MDGLQTHYQKKQAHERMEVTLLPVELPKSHHLKGEDENIEEGKEAIDDIDASFIHAKFYL